MTDKPELHPSFWNEYNAPKTNISWLVQMPESYITGRSLSNAYMRDFRAARKANQSVDK